MKLLPIILSGCSYMDITWRCRYGESGPDRNCDYEEQGTGTCVTGEFVLYDFGPDPDLQLQALRICRRLVDDPVPCRSDEVVGQAIGRDVEFVCPLRLDSTWEGGFSVYTAEAYP